MERQRAQKVRVTNGMEQAFTDRFDGVPIVIEPGKKVELDADEAAHLFGWHPDADAASMLKHLSKRQGWNTAEHMRLDPETKKTLAEALFEKLKIEPVTYVMVEQTKDVALKDDDEHEPKPDTQGEATPPVRSGRFKRPSATKRED